MSNELVSPNRAAHWSRLALTKTQLAALCGVTPRQIAHWTRRGYIRPSGAGSARYDGDVIDCVVLVKQGLDQGLPVRRAVGRAEAYLETRQVEQPPHGSIEPASLRDIRDRLQAAQAALGHVLAMVEPLLRTSRRGVPAVSAAGEEAAEARRLRRAPEGSPEPGPPNED